MAGSCAILGSGISCVTQESEALHADMHALAAEAAALRRDLEGRADMEAQYARRGSLQVQERPACTLLPDTSFVGPAPPEPPLLP